MIVENFGSQDLKDYQYEVDRGGKFVVYQYCFSIILLTSKQSSGIYLIKGGENAVVKGLGYTFLTFFLGW